MPDFTRAIRSAFYAAALLVAIAPSATAQNLYVTANRTIAGGNPINGVFDGVYVGVDQGGGEGSFINYFGVQADVVNPATISALNAYNDSTVTFYTDSPQTAIYTYGSSSVALINGAAIRSVQANENSFVTADNVSGNFFAYGHSRMDISGGTINLSTGSDNAVTARDSVINFFDASGNSVAHVSNGQLTSVSVRDNSVTTIDGSAITTDRFSNPLTTRDNSVLTLDNVTINGGFVARDASVINFHGGNLQSVSSVANTATLNLTGGTLTGTLYADNNASINIMGGSAEDIFTIGSSALNLTGGAIGRLDNYSQVTAKLDGGTVTTLAVGAGNVMINGSDILGGAAVYEGVLTLDKGSIQGGISTEGGITNINGGTVSGGVLAGGFNGQGSVNVTGGIVNGVASFIGSSTMDMSGGAVAQGLALDNSQFRFSGNGLGIASQQNATHWNGTDLYSGSKYTLTGTFNDGSSVTTTLTAGDFTGDATHLDFTGAKIAPDLFVLDDNPAVSGAHNHVYVGYDLNNTVTAPTVTITSGEEMGYGYIYGGNTVINGALIHADLFGSNFGTGNALQVTINDVTVGGQLGIGGRGNLDFKGGSVGGEFSLYDSASATIEGGTIPYLVVNSLADVNLFGGAIGAIDPILTDSNYQGIYCGTSNFSAYGSLSLDNPIAGWYYNVSGTYYTLTGTLLSGDAINSTFFLGNGNTLGNIGGGDQEHPILPRISANGVFTFTHVFRGRWLDPPIVSAFDFTMTDGNFFTKILDFPTGFSSAFTVKVGDTVLGSFTAGQEVDFGAFGFAGGVSSFTISDITPGADAGNPRGFPIRLDFSNDYASFTMSGVTGAAAAPEPGTAPLLFVGVCVLAFPFIRRGRGSRRPLNYR